MSLEFAIVAIAIAGWWMGFDFNSVMSSFRILIGDLVEIDASFDNELNLAIVFTAIVGFWPLFAIDAAKASWFV